MTMTDSQTEQDDLRPCPPWCISHDSAYNCTGHQRRPVRHAAKRAAVSKLLWGDD
jgi:hypothetical protein